jgi:hypothetical protein
MRILFLLSLIYTLTLCSQKSAYSSEPFTEIPTGTYEVVALELSKGLRADPRDTDPQSFHLAFRGGKLSNFWLIDHGWEAMHPQGGELFMGERGLTGDLNIRMYDVRGRNLAHAHLEFSITREGKMFSGTITGKVQASEVQNWQTSVKGTFLKPSEVFSEGASWSSFAGPSGTLSTSPNSPTLREDLHNSIPLWRSEAPVPVSYGNAADDRYPNRAAGCRFGGGSSSPVYADGVVYIAYYQPSIDIPPLPKKGYADKWFGEALENYARDNHLIQEEVQAIEDHWRPIADEVLSQWMHDQVQPSGKPLGRNEPTTCKLTNIVAHLGFLLWLLAKSFIRIFTMDSKSWMQ